ncbi:alpha-amylase family glycosyl hydrolase [Pseudofrankia sp. DC12]|uniref:alpha-amylase family glycosyl hydrolase n=1 Tax=Pseudofrankia sp. DC12 TaxID=683315 RepID=UPI0006969F70|nr:alpha-amylase family glycosyl hydrolase [Pseudofrankia sp. DC12]
MAGVALTSGWWRDAVFYEVYVRSFADADGDGVGDLDGVRARLPELADLGVNGLWLTPFYRSPMADHGYDVADHRDVDPLFGDLAAFDALLAAAHRLGVAVLVDLVPNHSSDAHPAFQAALAAAPGAAARHRYLIRPGRGEGGGAPPNNWISVFGGSAWTRLREARRFPEQTAPSSSAGPPIASEDSPADADGTRPDDWYLHLFAPEQPDWNWSDPAVRADHEATLRFWLDRGVDGFRIDVSHGLVKDDALRDNPPGPPATPETGFREKLEPHSWDQDGVHDVYRSWRRLVEGYRRRDRQERILVGETWVEDPERLSRYVRPDELHLTFSFSLLSVEWSAAAWRRAIVDGFTATGAAGTQPTWVLANHDVVRPASRYGGGEAGLRRARAALLTMLALPGVVFLYQGDELGLPQVDVAPAARQDPVWERSGHTSPGRDGCRVPIPWSGTEPPFGFAPDGVAPWLPQPGEWAALTVAAQRADPRSTWRLVQAALAFRHSHLRVTDLGSRMTRWRAGVPAGVLAFDRIALAPGGRLPRTPLDGGAASGTGPRARLALTSTRRPTEAGLLTCVLAAGSGATLAMPGRVMLASGPVEHDGQTLVLPPDTAAWVVRGNGPRTGATRR